MKRFFEEAEARAWSSEHNEPCVWMHVEYLYWVSRKVLGDLDWWAWIDGVWVNEIPGGNALSERANGGCWAKDAAHAQSTFEMRKAFDKLERL